MKMYGDWLRLDSVKPHLDELSTITAGEEVTSETKNRCGTSSEEELRYSGGRQGWKGFLWWAFLLQNILLICAAHQPKSDLNKCHPGIKTPGRTWPKGDIVLEYGQPLTIYCILDEFSIDSVFPRRNASDLVFFRNEELIGPEHITIVNGTTIVMHIDKPPPSSDVYSCKLKPNSNQTRRSYGAVCLNKVVIGFKPMEPKNFSCVSNNWENLTCSWEPAPNYIRTRFLLGFKLSGRIGGRSLYLCPDVSGWEDNREDDRSPNTCVWDVFTDPMYRQVREYYTFILAAKNVFGNASFIYKFHHYAHVIPSNPVDLSVVNKTSSSALIFWRIPAQMSNFPPGLHHRVSYRSQWDSSDSWQTVYKTDHSHAREIYFNLTNLQCANTVYEVRVSSKSSKAIGEEGWSRSSNITFKTAPANINDQIPMEPISCAEIRRDTVQPQPSKSNAALDMDLQSIGGLKEESLCGKPPAKTAELFSCGQSMATNSSRSTDCKKELQEERVRRLMAYDEELAGIRRRQELELWEMKKKHMKEICNLEIRAAEAKAKLAELELQSAISN